MNTKSSKTSFLPAPTEREAQGLLLDRHAAWTATVWSTTLRTGLDTEFASEVVMALGLGGETAEVLEELLQPVCGFKYPVDAAIKELGDALFYWCRIASNFGLVPSALYFEREPLKHLTCAEAAMHLVVAAGRVSELCKKYVRDDVLDAGKLGECLAEYAQHWRRVLAVLGLTLEGVIEANQQKIESRLSRGTLRGSGNYR